MVLFELGTPEIHVSAFHWVISLTVTARAGLTESTTDATGIEFLARIGHAVAALTTAIEKERENARGRQAHATGIEDLPGIGYAIATGTRGTVTWTSR